MLLFPPKADLDHLLVRAYVLIWVPGFFIAFFIYYAIQVQISQLEQLSKNDPINQVASLADSEVFPLPQRLLRDLRQRANGLQTNSPLFEYLLDLRLMVVAGLLFILALSTVLAWRLVNRARRPIRALSSAIRQLADGELDKPISIAGAPGITTLGEQLNQLRLRLNEANKTQTHFLRHVSHEVKTPLTSIIEGARLLSEGAAGSISKEQREVNNIILESSETLRNSIENLLNYNTALPLNKVTRRLNVDLAELVNEAIDKQAMLIKSKNLVINFESAPEPVMAFVDRTQIFTVFENLLSNAVKFSPDNGKVSMTLDHDNGFIEFLIEDDGPGINPKDQGAIFETFYVGDETSESKVRGTGLGLSIAKQYVELHSGMIELVATQGRGACFRVRLG